MPNVGWIRNELADYKIDYELIRHVMEGERTIKRYGTRYLPMPNPGDQSDDNKARYQNYKQRAVFYNVTSRTVKGMVGQLFLKAPVCKVPAGLNPVVIDSDGNGVPLDQIAMRCAHTVLSYGRAGLLTDYPTIQAQAVNTFSNTPMAIDKSGAEQVANDKPSLVPNKILSIKEIADNNIHPTIVYYHPWEILNWRTELRGAKRILTLVVLEDHSQVDDDGFQSTDVTRLRVLRLVNNTHMVETWEAGPTIGDEAPQYNQISIVMPTDSNGMPMQSIPFEFIGAETNDEHIDKPPVLDLATINVHHYCNSADFEETTFITGQPTLAIMGLTEQWLTTQLKGSISFGSRGGIPLPVGGDVKLLQASPNSLPLEAMKHKEDQMVALGAKLVQIEHTQKTATEVIVESTSESSTLSNIGKNVSAAITAALKNAAMYTGDNTNGIEYTLNDDFDLMQMTADERAQAVKEWQSGATAWPEMRAQLAKAGVATMDDDKAKAMITADLAEQAQAMSVGEPGSDPNAEGIPLGGKPTPAPGSPKPTGPGAMIGK